MKILAMLMSMILSFAPGALGMLFSPSGNSDAWYNALEKSVLNPAGWVFGVAWTVLYFLLGIALYLVITSTKSFVKKSKALTLFFFHMVMNALWSYLFFGLHMSQVGLLVILVLLSIAFFMQKEFRLVDKYAGYLVLPYIAWLFFALYLNGMIVYLN